MEESGVRELLETRVKCSILGVSMYWDGEDRNDMQRTDMQRCNITPFGRGKAL